MPSELEQLLAQLAEATAVHYDLPLAERLLAPVVGDPGILAAATPAVRCQLLLEWGWLHGATQRYDTAALALAEAVEIASVTLSTARTAADRTGLAGLLSEALRESAIVARYRGEFATAEQTLARSAEVAQANDDPLGVGRASFLRATVAHHLGDFSRARDLLDQATQATARYENRTEHQPDEASQLRADICREGAVSARIARDYDAARRLLAEAGERYAALGRRVGQANVLRELGAVLEQVGDEPAARDHYHRAFSGYLRAGRRIGAAAIARRLGYLDLVAGVEDPALLVRSGRRLTQALRLGGGEPVNAALTTLFQARLARLRGQLDDAEELLDAAAGRYLELAERAAARRDQRAGAPSHPVARNLSEIALESGLVARARGKSTTAVQRFTQALELLARTDDPGAASLAHFQLAAEYLVADQVELALPHAVASFQLNEESGRNLTDPVDRRTFYRQHRESYEVAMHCAARAGDGRAALTVATAATTEALAAFVRAGARLDPGLRRLVDDIGLATASAQRLPAELRVAAEADLAALYRRLEHATASHLRAYLGDQPPDLDAVMASLAPGEHALLLDVAEDDQRTCTRIWVHDGRAAVDQVWMTDEVRRLLDDYHQATAQVAWREQHRQLADLGTTAVPSGLTAALRNATDPARLVVCTGNLLGPVPVAALRIGDRNLAELSCLSVVPSLPLWASLRARPPRAGRGVLAFLDETLPGAQRERAALAAALAPLTWSTAAGLRAELTKADQYAVAVIGAHGSPPEAPAGGPPAGGPQPGGPQPGGPARTGLAQALALTPEDRLSAAELLTLNLPDGLITPSCWSGRLTVQTAAESHGIPTAALIAGARWVLAGTVDLGGTSTATLMATFYRMLASGAAPAVALRHAQCDLLRRRPTAPPAMWAGLTVVGDGFTTTGGVQPPGGPP